jgi:hypothetical protein
MAAVVEYPAFPSGEPMPLSAQAIQRVAADLRKQLFGFAIRPISVTTLTKRVSKLSVNGQNLRIVWDMEHAVHDVDGKPALGACEYDPCEPGSVMISLNAELLADRPEMQISTASHELGHAVFEMPAAIAARAARVLRSRCSEPAKGRVKDWNEWRADEFMGAFLAPKRPFTKAFAREAASQGLPLRWRNLHDVPTPFLTAAEVGWSAIDAVSLSLAEEFGVSDIFANVRLKKYDLITNK